MKTIICSSISAANEVIKVKKILENNGYIVEIPEGIKKEMLKKRTSVSQTEKAKDKIKYDLIRGYYEKIKLHDVVLIVNPKLKGVKGYIGGNTFIEMAFGYVLHKKLYCLYPIPELPYKSEMIAMQPKILNGNLSLIK